MCETFSLLFIADTCRARCVHQPGILKQHAESGARLHVLQDQGFFHTASSSAFGEVGDRHPLQQGKSGGAREGVSATYSAKGAGSLG